MGDDDRVVLRSTWTATICLFLALAAGVWTGTLLAGGSLPDPVMMGTFAVVSLLDRWLRRTVLTARGLEVWSLRGNLIPWSQITSVVVDGSRWNIRYITVRRTHGHAFVRLPAPLAPFGIGRGRVETARALVERMWVQHRDDALPAEVSG